MKILLRTFTCLSFALLPGLLAAQEATPKILFISENTSAKVAVEELVVLEYNERAKEAIRLTGNLEQWAAYEDVNFRGIPRTDALAAYNAYMDFFGLADDDPADKGFTDLLTAAGYDVTRSVSTFEEDPITGAVTQSHEFWPVGDPNSSGDVKLTEEQLARLNEFDLIILSRNTNRFQHSGAGRESGEQSTILIEQWNGLPTPIILLNAEIAQTNEFGSWGWGFTYGFAARISAIAPWDRQQVTGTDRFVFPDIRPKVRQSDADILAGIETVDDQRVQIYKDPASLPILPTIVRKFENNNNYVFPSNVKVILEFTLPSFVVNPVGNIETQNPIMLELQPGIRAFSPQNDVPAASRVALPAAPRLYFAAGAGNRGLFNLSSVGEQVFLNAVEKYVGGGGGVEPGPSGEWLEHPVLYWHYAYNDSVWQYSPELGYFVVDQFPWIYHFNEGWLYLSNGTVSEGAWIHSDTHGFLWVTQGNSGAATKPDGTIIQLGGQ